MALRFSTLIVVVFLSMGINTGESRGSGASISPRKFQKDDLGEIVGLVAYMIGRYAVRQDPRNARTTMDEWKRSSYVSSSYNIFVGERVLTNDVVEDAVGDICQLIGGSSMERSCRASEYVKYDWEAAYFKGEFQPTKELVKEAIGDICYVTSKYVLGRSEQRALDGMDECRRSTYVDFFYNWILEGKLALKNEMVKEIIGDGCYNFYLYVYGLNRENSKQWEKRCQNSKYVDLAYNLVQGKNGFTKEVRDIMAEDACYFYYLLVKKVGEREAQGKAMECADHELADLIKTGIKTIFKYSGWEVERKPRDFDRW